MPFYFATITPVIHYCTGGLEIDVDSVVVNSSDEAIPGFLDLAYYAEYGECSPQLFPGSAVMSTPFHVAIATPVIHYCTGGLEIEVDSVVVNSNG